ncbi:hypothetical protein Pfo_008536 [Paulownia fortunei]|nr:hypothetical protein Pfo_008536 [Paulownia fortunei]
MDLLPSCGQAGTIVEIVTKCWLSIVCVGGLIRFVFFAVCVLLLNRVDFPLFGGGSAANLWWFCAGEEEQKVAVEQLLALMSIQVEEDELLSGEWGTVVFDVLSKYFRQLLSCRVHEFTM